MPALPSGTVTLLFTDIEGSTQLLHRLGDRYAELLRDHHRLLRLAFGAWDGVEVDNQGDGFFVAFARAEGAVAAAAQAQRALASHPWPDGIVLRVRIGIHTGEPTLSEAGYHGIDVNRAARVMAAGHGGQVLLSETTGKLVDEAELDGVSLRDLGTRRLKDLAQPQRLYQLVLEGLPSEFPPLRTLASRATNLPAPPNALIGRERELEQCASLLRRDDVRLLTLTGPGGTGKTRLALELAAALLEEFRDGVFFVALAAISDSELVLPTIAKTLALREQPGQTLEETLD